MLLFLILGRHLRDRLLADLEREWKCQLLHGLLHGDYAALSHYHSAELLTRLNNDVDKVDNGILNIVPNTLSMIARLVDAAVVFGTLDLTFLLLVAVLGVTVILLTALMRRSLKNLNKQVSEHDGRVSGFLQETMEKLLMVQAKDVLEEVENRADVLLTDRYAIQRRRKNVTMFVNTSVSLFYYSSGFLALVWCAYRMLHGQMSFGSLTAVIQLVNQIQTPFVNLSGFLPPYVSMTVSAERIMELENIQGEPEPSSVDPKALYAVMEYIGADNLSFSYDQDKVLSDATFSLTKGAFTVIAGPSGMGKKVHC